MADTPDLTGVYKVDLGTREVFCIPISRVSVVFPENGALFRAEGTPGVANHWYVDRLADLETLKQPEGSKGPSPQERDTAYRLTDDHLLEDTWKRVARERHEIHHRSVPAMVLNVVDDDAPLTRVTRKLISAKIFSTCCSFNDVLLAKQH